MQDIHVLGDNIKMNLNETHWENMGLNYHNQDTGKVVSSCKEGNEILGSVMCRAFLTDGEHFSFSRKDLHNFICGAGNFDNIFSACGQPACPSAHRMKNE